MSRQSSGRQTLQGTSPVLFRALMTTDFEIETTCPSLKSHQLKRNQELKQSSPQVCVAAQHVAHLKPGKIVLTTVTQELLGTS